MTYEGLVIWKMRDAAALMAHALTPLERSCVAQRFDIAGDLWEACSVNDLTAEAVDLIVGAALPKLRSFLEARGIQPSDIVENELGSLAARRGVRRRGWTDRPSTPIVARLDARRGLDVGAVQGIERRGGEVCGDGFLYDDAPHRRGKMKRAVRQSFDFALVRLFAAGLSNRKICRITGLARMTVIADRRRLNGSHPCPCGQAATHRGWCRVRFAQSKKRQDFMSRWWPDRSWSYRELDGISIAWVDSGTLTELRGKP